MGKLVYLWWVLLISTVVLAVFTIDVRNDSYIQPKVVKEEVRDTLEIVQSVETNTMFGISVDSFDVHQGTIRRNQFLGDILKKHNVSSQQLHELSNKSKKVFDVRKLAYRQPYTLFCERDSLKTANYFVYQPNKIEYVVYKLKDSIEVYQEFQEMDTVEHAISGIIETSLWETMINAGAMPELAHAMSEVYAWQVDFYRIQKGDKFKVVYEQIYVDGEPAGMGKILGAYFNHFGEDYYAFYFDQGSGISYFDEEGQSLQKQFLRAPLRYKRISSRYTRKRYHPVQKRYKAHLGTDYAAAPGTPIRTVGDGIVEEARYNRNNGYYVKIRHNGVYTTQYLHMSDFAKGIKKGVKVKQGQTIGFVGSTGLASGPHLCFRFWKNGRQIDALKVKLPPSEPVKEEYRVEFEIAKEIIFKKLESIQFPNTRELALANTN